MKTTRRVTLTKEEVNSLKEFCDDNLERGSIEIIQSAGSGIGLNTHVRVRELPDTEIDITDYEAW
jgi:hypothetical protein